MKLDNAAVIANTFRYLRNFAWVEYLITTPWAEKAADQRWRLGGGRFVRINHETREMLLHQNLAIHDKHCLEALTFHISPRRQQEAEWRAATQKHKQYIC